MTYEEIVAHVSRKYQQGKESEIERRRRSKNVATCAKINNLDDSISINQNNLNNSLDHRCKNRCSIVATSEKQPIMASEDVRNADWLQKQADLEKKAKRQAESQEEA